MKISVLVIGVLLPSFSLAQESQPTSAPADSQPLAVSVSAPPQEEPTLNVYNKNGERAYKISLYSTVAGVAGTFAFNSLGLYALRNIPNDLFGSISVSRAMFGVSGLFGTLTLFGPSLGHFYAGEVDRGAKLLVRRAVIPTTMLVGGVITTFVSFSVLSVRLATEEPVGAGPIVGMGTGIALIAAGGITYWVMSGKHIVDARNAPAREAERRGLKLAGSLAPVPFYDAGTRALGMGATLRLNF
jgi:flagellar basal body-associated protein FliL